MEVIAEAQADYGGWGVGGGGVSAGGRRGDGEFVCRPPDNR